MAHELSPYFVEGVLNLPDCKVIALLKDIIREAIIFHHAFGDCEEIEGKTEIIFPLVVATLFNSNFNLRRDEHAVDKLISYLVKHLA